MSDRKKGKPVYAARYLLWGEYFVALYDTDINPDERPHEDWLMFTKKEWREMGGKMPPKNGHVAVRLCIGEK